MLEADPVLGVVDVFPVAIVCFGGKKKKKGLVHGDENMVCGGYVGFVPSTFGLLKTLDNLNRPASNLTLVMDVISKSSRCLAS